MHSSKKIRLLKIAVSITCVIVMLFAVSGISSYAVAVSNEIDPIDTVPLRTGYIQMPTEMVGARFLTLDGVTNTDAFYALLFLNSLTDPSASFRYRFHGSDPGVYITQFTTEVVNDTEFRIYGADGFVPRELFATVSFNDSMQTVIFEPVDFVCVAETMSIDYISNLYALGLAGYAVPLEYFIDYGSGGGGSIPSCPTLPEMLASYNGTFDSIVDMLNTRNYDEYSDYVDSRYDDGYDDGYSDAVGLRGSLQAGQIRLLDEVLDFSAFYDEYPPTEQFTYSDNFNFQIFGGYHADYMIVQYSFGTGYQTLQYSFTDEDSGGLTLISRTSTNTTPDTTWLVPRGRLIVIDSMPDDPRFVQFIEDNSSIVDGVQATKLYDYGYGVGYSEGWTNSAIGDAFKAPIDALNNIVLLETAGVTITLGGVILAMISLSIMIVFLKKFAGG